MHDTVAGLGWSKANRYCEIVHRNLDFNPALMPARVNNPTFAGVIAYNFLI